jgi:hypothetical protein
VSNAQARALLEKMESIHATLDQVYGLVNPLRPQASDMSFQCMQSPELADQEVVPGRTFAQVGEELCDAVESIAALMSTATANLAILMSAARGTPG